MSARWPRVNYGILPTSKYEQMKSQTIFFLLTVLIVSCTSIQETKIANSGIVEVTNGQDKKDSLKYTCDSCDKYIKLQSTLKKVIDEATKEAKASLNNPLSFVPRTIKITITPKDSLFYFKTNQKVDSCKLITANYECIGKNAYGTEGLVKSTSYIFLIGDSIHENFLDALKKTPLYIEDGKIVSRTLYLYDVDGEGKFTILPTISMPNSLIVTSSISCIDKGALLTITFDDNTKISLSNWKRFNCEGTAYFNLGKSDKDALKSKKLHSISFYVDNQKSQYATLPDNESDYLMQYVNLIK